MVATTSRTRNKTLQRWDKEGYVRLKIASSQLASAAVEGFDANASSNWQRCIIRCVNHCSLEKEMYTILTNLWLTIFGCWHNAQQLIIYIRVEPRLMITYQLRQYVYCTARSIFNSLPACFFSKEIWVCLYWSPLLLNFDDHAWDVMRLYHHWMSSHCSFHGSLF